MTKKIRLIRTMVLEYTPDAENYPEGSTIEQMAEIDSKLDDPNLTFSQDLEKDEIKWEIVDYHFPIEEGTKVKIKEDLVVDNFYNGLQFHRGMTQHIGKIAVVKGNPHYNSNAFQIDIDKEGYDWSKEMFDVIDG